MRDILDVDQFGQFKRRKLEPNLSMSCDLPAIDVEDLARHKARLLQIHHRLHHVSDRAHPAK